MKHSHALVLEKLYSDFSSGDLDAVMAACADKMTFQVPGKGPMNGKYDKKSFVTEYLVKMNELSEGTHKVQVHDILASDLHAVVLASQKLTRNGKEFEYRTAHVWRFEGGKPVAWYEYPRDLYAYDAIWS